MPPKVESKESEGVGGKDASETTVWGMIQPHHFATAQPGASQVRNSRTVIE